MILLGNKNGVFLKRTKNIQDSFFNDVSQNLNYLWERCIDKVTNIINKLRWAQN